MRKSMTFLMMVLVLFLVWLSDSFAGVKKEAPKKLSAPKPAAEAPAAAPRGFMARGGLMGGCGMAEIGYLFPVRNLNAGVYLGYGLGNKYNALAAQVETIFKLQAVNVALSVDYVNYSELVRNIPGLSGDTAKGASTGLGLRVSRDLNPKLSAGLGYSTALGLTATAGYKF